MIKILRMILVMTIIMMILMAMVTVMMMIIMMMIIIVFKLHLIQYFLLLDNHTPLCKVAYNWLSATLTI